MSESKLNPCFFFLPNQHRLGYPLTYSLIRENGCLWANLTSSNKNKMDVHKLLFSRRL